MNDSTEIREHMEVVGADGNHVGAVDRVEGDRIKLTKNDPAAGGQHHYIDMDAVAAVEQGMVRLRMTAIAAQEQWESADDQGEDRQIGRSGEAGQTDQSSEVF